MVWLASLAGFLPSLRTWLWLAVVGGLLLGLGYYRDALHREQLAHARSNAAADKRQADALAAEIKRHETAVTELQGVNSDAQKRIAQLEAAASAAGAALDAAAAAGRRLRDANATTLIAARAAIEQAGVASQCAPALEAARVRAELLDRIDAAAGQLAERARIVSRHADAAAAAGQACERAYEVTR